MTSCAITSTGRSKKIWPAARLAALQAFGNPVALREQTHDTWSWSGMELLLNDVRFGARALLLIGE